MDFRISIFEFRSEAPAGSERLRKPTTGRRIAECGISSCEEPSQVVEVWPVIKTITTKIQT
jgi:hypothetical protein